MDGLDESGTDAPIPIQDSGCWTGESVRMIIIILDWANTHHVYKQQLLTHTQAAAAADSPATHNTVLAADIC